MRRKILGLGSAPRQKQYPVSFNTGMDFPLLAR
jgi:hypothetical protein